MMKETYPEKGFPYNYMHRDELLTTTHIVATLHPIVVSTLFNIAS
jgi:hypothetical protein